MHIYTNFYNITSEIMITLVDLFPSTGADKLLRLLRINKYDINKTIMSVLGDIDGIGIIFPAHVNNRNNNNNINNYESTGNNFGGNAYASTSSSISVDVSGDSQYNKADVTQVEEWSYVEQGAKNVKRKKRIQGRNSLYENLIYNKSGKQASKQNNNNNNNNNNKPQFLRINNSKTVPGYTGYTSSSNSSSDYGDDDCIGGYNNNNNKNNNEYVDMYRNDSSDYVQAR